MWSTKRRNNNHSNYSLRCHHNGGRRRRKGRKSLIYTRFRCDPDPWQGSPPKTPPSSDDENDNTLPIKTSHHSSITHLNKNININVNNNNNNNNRQRINIVKRKLSKYVKMENANVLQSSHQFMRKQTKLNIKKTAPVPIPIFTTNNNNNNNNISTTKQMKQQKELKQQKQTAPVPIPLHLMNLKSKSKSKLKPKHKTKTKSKSKSKMKTKNKTKIKPNKVILTTKQNKLEINDNISSLSTSLSTINTVKDDGDDGDIEYSSSNQNLADTYFDIVTPTKQINNNNNIDKQELIDFASIPEAYYIGYDNNMPILTQNSSKYPVDFYPDHNINNDNDKDEDNDSNENVLDIDINVIEKEINASVDEHYITPNGNSSNNNSDEIVIYSPISTQRSFTNNNLTNYSDSSLPTNNNKKDIYFDDDKFTSLAASILHERQEYENIYNINSNNNNNNNINMINNDDRFDCNQYKYNDNNNYNKENIWAEPNFNIDINKERPKQTLGNLLMNGLPPISINLFH